jgi:hypothetical protein
VDAESTPRDAHYTPSDAPHTPSDAGDTPGDDYGTLIDADDTPFPASHPASAASGSSLDRENTKTFLGGVRIIAAEGQRDTRTPL